MKNCSHSADVANLLAGNLQARQRRQVITHVRRCPTCQSIIAQHERTITLLSLIRRRRDGNLVVTAPEIPTDFVARLKTTAAHAYAQKRQEISEPEQLLAYVVSRMRQWWAQASASESEQLIGYAAMPASVDQRKGTRSSSRLMRELGDQAARLLESLLDPKVPLETRVRWCRHLTIELRRTTRPHRKTTGKASAVKRRG